MITHALLVGTDGTIWANSNNWESMDQETLDEHLLRSILDGFDNRENLYNAGIDIGSTHFVIQR
jgi:hypothetical protein